MPPIRPQYILRFLLVLLIGGFLYAILRPGNAGPAAGQTTPNFELSDMNGRKLQLSDYRGKVVVLNFWATWCPPCVEEMPSLNRFQQVFAPKGIVVLAVSVDDDERALRDFAQKFALTMPVLRDPGRQTSAAYQTYKYPETYILDRQGRLVQKVTGAADWSGPAMTSFFDQLAAR